MSSMGSNNLGISELTIGINSTGMEEYKEQLRTDLLQTSKDKINSVDAIVSAINNGWQGVSRDRFLKQFDDVRQKICDDLDKEYADLENRLTDLQSAYYAADQNLIQE